MTRLQAALLELRAALGDRAWVLVLDPAAPDAQEWGFSMEHSAHAGYVRLGLLRMAATYQEDRLLRGGKNGKPLFERALDSDHDFDPSTENLICRRCFRSRLEVMRGMLRCVPPSQELDTDYGRD